MTPEQLERLFRRWYKPLRNWIANLTSRKHGTLDQDIAQEVFLRLMKYAGDIPPGAEKKYLFSIAKRCVINWHELKANYSEHDTSEEALLGFVDEDADPQLISAADDEQASVERAMEQLPARYVEALRLHIHEDMSVKEIASAVGMSTRQVTRDLVRAYARLRELLPEQAERHREGMSTRPPTRKVRRPSKRRAAFSIRPFTPDELERIPALLDAADYNVKVVARVMGRPYTSIRGRVEKMFPNLYELREQRRADKRKARNASGASDSG